MSDYKSMKEKLEKLQNVKGGLTSLVSESKKLFQEDLMKIKQDQMLSGEGKRQKEAALRKEYGEALLKSVKEAKDERDKAIIGARIRAQAVLNEKPKKPHEEDLQTFNRHLSDLKMELMLGTNAQKSLDKLKEFIGEQNDPYLVQSTLDEFPGLVNSVLETNGADKDRFKLELQGVYRDSKQKAMTDEQKEAAQIQAQMEGALDRNLFVKTDDGEGRELQVIRETFGDNIARYANKPNYYPFPIEKEEEGQGAE